MIKIKSIIWLLIALSAERIYCKTEQAKIDPFSKITITSQKAVCKKSNILKNIFILTYLNDIVVTLADGSKITSGSLEITIDGNGMTLFNNNNRKQNQSKKNKNISHIKK